MTPCFLLFMVELWQMLLNAQVNILAILSYHGHVVYTKKTEELQYFFLNGRFSHDEILKLGLQLADHLELKPKCRFLH